MGFLLTQVQMKKLKQAIERKFTAIRGVNSTYDGAYSKLAKDVELELGEPYKECCPKDTWFCELFSKLVIKEKHSFNLSKLNACCQYVAGVDAHEFFLVEKFPTAYVGLYKCYYLEEEHGLCIGFIQIKSKGYAFLKTVTKHKPEEWYKGQFQPGYVKRMLTGVFRADADYTIQFAFQTPFAQPDNKHLEGVYLGINPDLGLKPFAGFMIMELLVSGNQSDLSNDNLYRPFSMPDKKSITEKGEEKYMDILIGKQKGGFIEGSTALLVKMGFAKWRDED